MQKNSRLLAVLETLDNGKPIRETRDIDVPLVARHFYHHAGWAQLVEREFPGHAPVGVVGQIIPWNFPLLMLAWKVAPALAAGNTVVLKPAEYTSLTALAFAELLQAAHLPPGVVNFVTGDGRTGAALVDHPGVDKIAFTGSTDVGRAIRRATAGSGKRLSLELGGKSPFLVFDDADIDSVIEGAVDAIWFNQGQVCCAGSRLLVQESVSERVIEKLRARMEKLRVGDPLDKAVDIGAIVAPVQLERIQKLVRQGVEEGATLWQPSWACPKEGLFYPPTLLTGVAPSATVAQVEIFGPVLVAMSFRTPAEAIALANNTTFGLAASVWTENVNLALDMARKIKAGTVWINATNLFDASSGFGGYRESGFGREGGREGMFEYLQPMHAPRPITLPRATSSAPPPLLDRTAKLFIGGKQARPDQGYSLKVLGPDGQVVGEVAEGNRKDIRNAVEAAHAAEDGWAYATAHLRAQILYYVAENLAARAPEFADRIALQTGRDGVARGRDRDLAPLQLRGLGRQVRRRGARRAAARADARARRADRRHGPRLPRRGAAAGLRLAAGPGGRHGQHGGDRAVGAPPALGHRPLPGARDLRPAGRRRQHRDRPPRRPGPGARRARRRGRGLVLRQRERRGRGREALHRQHEAHLDRAQGLRLLRPRDRRGTRVPARGHPGQEHLDPERRVTYAPFVKSGAFVHVSSVGPVDASGSRHRRRRRRADAPHAREPRASGCAPRAATWTAWPP